MPPGGCTLPITTAQVGISRGGQDCASAEVDEHAVQWVVGNVEGLETWMLDER